MKNSISDIMQKKIISVSMDDNVATIEELFKINHIASAPVYDDMRDVIGVVTVTDLVNFHARGKDPYAVKVWEICSYSPMKMPPEASILAVADSMLTNHIHHILVMKKNELVGIVSSLDFVRIVAEQKSDSP